MKKSALIEIIATLLIMMFLYASFSKYFGFKQFEIAMHNQPFPYWFSAILIWVLPLVEIGIAILLFMDKTKRVGLIASTAIMTLFTLYIAIILLHFFPRVPCSCGGVIMLLNWNQHLIFNLFFLFISFLGYKLQSGSEKSMLQTIKEFKNISRAKSG